METDFVMICPVTQLPCTQGCAERRTCTVAGTAVDIVACVLPGALLLLLAVVWYLRARGLV